jgi:hypothetical protein
MERQVQQAPRAHRTNREARAGARPSAPFALVRPFRGRGADHAAPPETWTLKRAGRGPHLSVCRPSREAGRRRGARVGDHGAPLAAGGMEVAESSGPASLPLASAARADRRGDQSCSVLPIAGAGRLYTRDRPGKTSVQMTAVRADSCGSVPLERSFLAAAVRWRSVVPGPVVAVVGVVGRRTGPIRSGRASHRRPPEDVHAVRRPMRGLAGPEDLRRRRRRRGPEASVARPERSDRTKGIHFRHEETAPDGGIARRAKSPDHGGTPNRQ